MLKNYLTIAFRSLKRNIGFSIINIVGLAVGMAAAILIIFWVADEVSFDRFHKNLHEIYRVYEHQAYSGTDDLRVYNTPGPLAPELKAKFPQIKRVARFTPVWRRVAFELNDNIIYNDEGYLADPEALEMFTFESLHGSIANALADPNSIILSHELAQQCFGNENPVGKSLKANGNMVFNVKGVINRPKNTHLRFSFIVPFQGNIERFWGGQNINWTNNSFYSYIQIDETVNYKEVEAQIAKLVADNGQDNVTLYLEPLSRSYLYNIWGSGAIRGVRIFSAVALLILLIACINFMNLTTARSTQRAKEVGLRKVSGSSKRQLVQQFLGESILLTLIAFVLAIALVALFLPQFNDISGKSIELKSLSAALLGAAVSVALVTGIVAGSYPSFFLASFAPIKVLKSEISKGSKTFRTVLVVVQFSLSVALIVSTLTIGKQLNYMVNKDLGFSKSNIITINFSEGGIEKYNTLKDELLKYPSVEAVTMATGLPHQIGNSTSGVSWEGKDPNENALFSFTIVHLDYEKVFGMKLAQGRWWDKSITSDSVALVVNQEAVRVMGLNDPIGQHITFWGGPFEIIGVVENFHFQGLKSNIEPLIMSIYGKWQGIVSVKLTPSLITSAVSDVEKVWKEVYPNDKFEYSFFDQSFDYMYRTEMRMLKLFTSFSVLAILISCLGLFGLASFMAEQKFREVGIRKTLGASQMQVMWLLVWDFVKWVLVANMVGCIIAFYLMEAWLRGYAYRLGIQPEVFLWAALLSVAVALVTVSYQAWKVSSINPVTALKYE